MTQQEQEMIAGLIQRVQSAPLSDKDPQAEQYLQQGLGRNPDALYILAQTVLVQGYALEQAQKQLADLRAQSQQQQSQKHTSFLGSIFGAGEPDRATPPQPSSTGYSPVPSYSQPQPPYVQPVNYQQSPPSGGGGFLRGAMQTAAGVAAGAVAFEGIETLMRGFGGHGGSSGFGSFGGGDTAPREEIVNNYYGDGAPGNDNRGMLRGDDIEDRRDDSSSSGSDFADTSDDDDTSSNDDISLDESGSDDSNFA